MFYFVNFELVSRPCINKIFLHSSFTAFTTGHPKNEFSQHFIIKPEIYHGRHKRAIRNTLEEVSKFRLVKNCICEIMLMPNASISFFFQAGSHASHISLSYIHDGERIIADLKLNEELIPQGHFLRYQNGTGGNALKTFNKTDINLCHYQVSRF